MKQITLIRTAALATLFTAASASLTHLQAQTNTYYEDFSGGLGNWVSWGSPRPVVAASIAGKTSVFDNNGDPNYDSGAYSKGLVGSSGGFLLESDELLQMSNPAGCWLALNLGLTQTPNPSNPDSGDTQDNGNGIRISFWFDGDACWASPPELHRHAWAAAHLYAEDGTYVDSAWSGFNADAFTNAWQHLSILVLPDRTAKFYIGTNLLWTAPKKLHPSVLAGQNIVLSGRSSGSAGKAYHDNVRFTATQAQTDTYYEDFSGGLTNWVSWGSPRPVVAASIAGKTSVFDNNGDPNYDSGAYSKGLVGSTGGFLLESDELLQMSNPAGCWLALNLGLTQTPNPSNPDSGDTQDNGNGIRISFWFDGDACWASPPELHRHAWAAAHLYAEDGTYVDSAWSGFNADAFTNAWQNLRILVLPDRTAKFYIGTNLLWTAPKKLHPSVLAGQNIVLSGRSSGSAGKAYHDNVRFTAIANDFFEDFDNGLADWTSFGQPRPVVVGSFQGRTNVFDNMGDGMYNSGAQTKTMVAAPGGFVLQWDNYLQVYNTAGCWAANWVGLTKNPNPVNGDNGGVDDGQGIMFSMDYAGGACWGTPAEYRYHAYLNCLVYAEDGTYDHPTDYSLNGDAYINSWQTMTIQVTPDRFAHFYMGTNLVWSSTKRLHPSIMEGQTLASSGRSSGSAGKVYVDQIRFSEMPSITAQPVTQSVGPGGEVTFSVGAGGAQPLTYQWYLNGAPIAGATNASLTINKVGCEKVGTYSVTVGNWAGTITSQSAILSLLGLQMCATLDLCGPVSTPYLIEFKTSLNTNWTTLTNITLPASPFTFIDLGSRGQPQRFYRATPLP